MAMEPIRRRNDDAFWQRLVLPEEERPRIAIGKTGIGIKTASLNAELANWRARRRTSGDEPVGLPSTRYFVGRALNWGPHET